MAVTDKQRAHSVFLPQAHEGTFRVHARVGRPGEAGQASGGRRPRGGADGPIDGRSEAAVLTAKLGGYVQLPLILYAQGSRGRSQAILLACPRRTMFRAMQNILVLGKSHGLSRVMITSFQGRLHVLYDNIFVRPITLQQNYQRPWYSGLGRLHPAGSRAYQVRFVGQAKQAPLD